MDRATLDNLGSGDSRLVAQVKPQERIALEHLATGDSLFTAQEFELAIESWILSLDTFREAMDEETPFHDEIRGVLFKLYVAGIRNVHTYPLATRYGLEYLQYNPADEATVRNLANVFRAKNDLRGAIAMWVEYDERFDSFTAKQEIGRLFADSNDITNAISWYNRALEQNKDADILQRIATLYINNREPQRAIAAYEDFIKTEPPQRELRRAYMQMGRIFSDMNSVNRAIQYYELASDIEFDRSASHWLADKYHDQKNYTRANVHIQRMLERNPNDVDAIFLRAEILFEQNRFAEARVEYQKLVNHARYGSIANSRINHMNQNRN
jgi:tetratricopeptide (TPR) repeat protein